jgi:putative nucleotidyltransferase with HDIG domain
MLSFASGLVASTGEVTARHSRTVAALAVAVTEELDLDDSTRQLVEAAALLHDVGKAEIPDAILGKRGPLTRPEERVVQTHTVLGEELLVRADRDLSDVGSIVRSCHERWDGAGYPDGLAGEEIPLAARIIFCCDAYEAMTSDRPYRRAVGHGLAVKEIQACAGSQFDPAVASALVRALDRARKLASRAKLIDPRAPRASAPAISG